MLAPSASRPALGQRAAPTPATKKASPAAARAQRRPHAVALLPAPAASPAAALTETKKAEVRKSEGPGLGTPIGGCRRWEGCLNRRQDVLRATVRDAGRGAAPGTETTRRRTQTRAHTSPDALRPLSTSLNPSSPASSSIPPWTGSPSSPRPYPTSSAFGARPLWSSMAGRP